MDRRNFMSLAGGGLVLAATPLLSGCEVFEVPASAVAAWQAPAAQTEIRRWVLSHALLAPNPHNMQPWLADLRRPGEISLSLDPQRLLPATDPFGRQILMGAGAFLELLSLAAAERGFRAEVALFPDGLPGQRLAANGAGGPDERPFARVRLQPDAGVPRDPLFAQVPHRRTDRRAYDPTKPPTATELQALQAAAGAQPVRFGSAGPAQAAQRDAIRAIVREAWRIELSTEAPMMESMRVLRIGSAEIDQHRDGISLTSPMLVALAKTGLLDRRQFPAPDSMATQGQIRDFDSITASTPAYLWLVTEGNQREQQIAAGRAYARVNLAATAAGLALHPNEQSLQEFAEVAGQYQAIHTLLDAPPPRFTVQMLARVGHLPPGTPAAPPAPRRGLDRQLRA